MKMTTTTLLMLLLIGFFAGVLSGLVGVGGGVIMVPLFVLLLGMTQYNAQGYSLAVMLPPITLLAVYNYHKNSVEGIDWKAVLIISVMFFLSSYIGSKIAVQIDQRILKKIFGGVLLLVAIKFLLGK